MHVERLKPYNERSVHELIELPTTEELIENVTYELTPLLKSKFENLSKSNIVHVPEENDASSEIFKLSAEGNLEPFEFGMTSANAIRRSKRVVKNLIDI